MRFYEQCGDCGTQIKVNPKHRGRPDVCDECWDRREWLVAHMSEVLTKIGMVRFQGIQRSMIFQRGTAKQQIIKVMEEVGGANGVTP